tara:strand:+ start:1491 stop:2387 length:897 start_codon:yes stop_codon:yes gene_type:complete
MQTKNCPICNTRDNSLLIYKEKLPENLNDTNFAGRKTPDGFHYKMLRCLNCSLLYASEIYDEEYSNKLYEESTFDYSDELKGLTKSYSKCLVDGLKILKNEKQNFLEIGCGNGFMLNEAIKFGFKNVKGIEPSKEAISFADKHVKKFIHHGIFTDKDEASLELYDVVFIAMIIEHVVDANKFLNSIYKILKPGGIIICISHNERHLLSKVLKDKHPIINDEHVAVFNKEALKKIFEKNNFVEVQINNLKNFYSIRYWLKMLKITPFIERIFNNKVFRYLMALNVGFKAGNLYLIAKKK